MLPYFQLSTIYLGPIPIQFWGLMVALGLIASSLIVYKRSKRLGYNPELLLDMVLWMVIGGFVVARIFHVFFYDPTFYLSNIFEIIKIWKGGLSSFGGLFGAGIGLWLYLKKKKLNMKHLLSYLDIMTFGALYGWMIGRLGCFGIHDHWGIPCNCALAVNTPEGPRLDMAFLEILGLVPLAIIFFILRKRKLSNGWFLSVMFIYYGALRFILDFFRATDIANPDARYLGLTPAQYFAILLVAVGLFIIRKDRVKS